MNLNKSIPSVLKEVRYYKVGRVEFIPHVASTIIMLLLPTK